ncbi:unnamed protein product [Menidia menidia]|uniref:PDZ and LIM domain protein 7 n=1 Tax=Menidia menidia TaxID=238744 RepID=A0A8S4BNY2_9TELE|nr:unnamed protein product [Menidia menidia]
MSGEQVEGQEAMNLYTVTLSGPAPWGFRLQGGKDFNMPLAVSRLTPGGKAAQAGVGVGDWVVSICDTNAEDMTHVEAQNKIRGATDSLTLTLSRAFKASQDHKMENLDKAEATYYDDIYQQSKHGLRVEKVPCFIPNDRSKKRLIQDTEDWQPRTGTTQSRSFRILAQLTGTDFMQDPDDEIMKRSREKFLTEIQSPRYARLRDWHHDRSGNETVELKPKSQVRIGRAKDLKRGNKSAMWEIVHLHGITLLLVKRRVVSGGNVKETRAGSLQVGGGRCGGCSSICTCNLHPSEVQSEKPLDVVRAPPAAGLLPAQGSSAGSLEPNPSPAKAQTADKPDGSKTAAAGSSGPSCRPPWVTDPNFADRFRPDKTSTVVTQHQQPVQPTPMQSRSSILQAAQQAPEDSGRTPLCGACNKIIRGRYLVALGRSWHPEEFTCSQCKLVLEEGGFFEERGSVYCTKCHDNRYAPNCAKCKKKITGEIMHALKMTYHVQCFKCAACKNPIRNQAFYMEEGEPYCERDYEKMFGTKCHGCDFKIDAGDRFLEALGYSWHDTCFVCALCQINLEGKTFYSKKDKPLCKSHAFAPV